MQLFSVRCRITPWLWASGLCVLWWGLGACQGTRQAQATGDTFSSAATLQRGSWVVQTLGGPGRPAPVLPRTQLTLRFRPDQGTVSGDAGCNRYEAPYQLRDSSLTIQPPGATRRLCDQPSGVMAQEELFLGLLRAVQQYRIEDEGTELLYLRCANGAQVVLARPVE